jgi:PAS domain S-box-containing protein
MTTPACARTQLCLCRGIVQLTNQAACDTLGFHRNDLVGRNVNQIIPP